MFPHLLALGKSILMFSHLLALGTSIVMFSHLLALGTSILMFSHLLVLGTSILMFSHLPALGTSILMFSHLLALGTSGRLLPGSFSVSVFALATKFSHLSVRAVDVQSTCMLLGIIRRLPECQWFRYIYWDGGGTRLN